MEFISELIFWCFVLLTIASAAVVVFHKRVIYSAFALLFTFFGVAALYLYMSADFLAASQLLIYVGGILTLIIFGVFLTTRIMTIDIPQQTHQRYLALIPIALIGVVLIAVILTSQWQTVIPETKETTEIIGRLLLSDYLVPFEVASILLLAALIGAMQLARYFWMEE